EDDKRINEGIKFNLELDGFICFSGNSLKEGRIVLKDEKIDLIILDINLPDGNGFDFCKEIRETSTIPIIFLTANDMEMDQIRGFKVGGDDYVTKPFSIGILTQRVIALLRRRKKESLRSGDCLLDLEKMSFYKEDVEISLSPIEFKIVKKLLLEEDKIVKREDLLSYLWDEDIEFIEEHALTVNINRIRGKLKSNAIKTIYGKGYMWSLRNE
ncbi:response regulator transcription factor, partial [uncultured Clostridium sp.]|uniref:response regulator transcription factor n=1 Tax=uncultured Clostridium sp. TaxID=59620 RepID=UPI00262692BF